MSYYATATGPVRPHKGGYRLLTRDDVGFDDFPAWPEGPTTVVTGGWGVSYSTGDHIEGAILHAYETPINPEEGIGLHELDGTTYPDRREASRAAFDAGLLAFMVYFDDKHKWPASADLEFVEGQRG